MEMETRLIVSPRTAWKAEAVFQDGSWDKMGIKKEGSQYVGDEFLMVEFMEALEERRVIYLNTNEEFKN
jgi:hypothetical protein